LALYWPGPGNPFVPSGPIEVPCRYFIEQLIVDLSPFNVYYPGPGLSTSANPRVLLLDAPKPLFLLSKFLKPPVSVYYPGPSPSLPLFPPIYALYEVPNPLYKDLDLLFNTDLSISLRISYEPGPILAYSDFLGSLYPNFPPDIEPLIMTL